MNDNIDDLPNFMFIDERQEKPEEIIEDYLDMINHHKNDPAALEETLHDFFDDINRWTVRQLMIDQAKMNIYNLQMLDELENEFIDEDEED